MPEDKKIRQNFELALKRFVEQVKQDKNILAILVGGSYANGVVWEHSDIDMFIVTNEEQVHRSFIAIYDPEYDVNIYIGIMSRNQYRTASQRLVQGGIMHHLLSTSDLVYESDQGIAEIKRDIHSQVAERDKETQILTRAELLIVNMFKAQKTLYVEEDIEKCFNWVILTLQELARILILKNSKVPGRDVLSEVKNLELEDPLVIDIIKSFKTGYDKSNLNKAIDKIESFLISNKTFIFKPLFEYLKEVNGERKQSEIDEHFLKALGSPTAFFTLVESVEWLSHQGDLMRSVSPVRVTAKSRVTVNEATVYYLGET
ncbi:MAG: nucleotidyltransferase domain-containing protein [Candidatus Hodarchaeales archaeon]